MNKKKTSVEMEKIILNLLQDCYLDIDGSVKPIEELYREQDLSEMMYNRVYRLLVDVERDIERYDNKGVDG